jgi:TIR domain
MSAFDVFVSHAEADRWWVEGYLLDALAEAGLRVQREATFQLGTPRLAEFSHAVAESRRTLLVLSPAFMADGPAHFVALLAQQYGADTHTWPVIPLTLHAVEQLDPTLAMLVGLDACSPADWGAVVRRLCAELRRPLPEAPPAPPCPYPGMRAFRIDEGPAFFGRDAEVRALVEQHLRLHPFVALIGASGSGKSSLVFAGLVPALRKSPFFGAGHWDIRTLRPGADPQTALQAAIANSPATGPRLLVVDQFEEIFTFARAQGDADRAAFCDTVLALAAGGWHVVLTMRADFYGDLMRLTKLWPEVRQHRFELTRLDREVLRAAILGPSERAHVFVEPALVERLLADAGSEPGILPFLQETLLLLWAGLERRCLPAVAYERLVADTERMRRGGTPWRSGLGVAMATRADQALAALPSDAARDIARRVLLRLVQFGEGRADTRRQQRRGELRSGDDDPTLFDEVMRQLVAARLLIASGGEKSGTETDDVVLDIAHEALLSGWPQLADWIEKRREGEQTRRWLRQQAKRWLERVRAGQGGGLLDEVETAEAERWRDRYGVLVGRDAAVDQLIETSRQEVDRERDKAEHRGRQELARLRRQRRRTVAGLVAALLLAAAASWFAFQSSIAEKQARTAEDKARRQEDQAKQSRDKFREMIEKMADDQRSRSSRFKAVMARVPQEALDIIVLSEIGSKKFYERTYEAPLWPGGGASGVNIGISSLASG